MRRVFLWPEIIITMVSSLDLEVKIGAVVEAGFHIEVMATQILVIPSKDIAEAAGIDIILMLDQISSDSLKCWRQKRDQGLRLWLIPAID